MRILYKRLACADLQEFVNYLDTQDSNQPLRQEFLTAFDETCVSLLRFPQVGRIDPLGKALELPQDDIRRMAVNRFPVYLIFYSLRAGNIVVRRVLHGARNLALRLAEPA